MAYHGSRLASWRPSQSRPRRWTKYSLRPLTLCGCEVQPLFVLLKTVVFHTSICMVDDSIFAEALCGGYTTYPLGL